MARKPREKSLINTYLISLKVNEDILLESSDFKKMLEIIRFYNFENNSKLYAYSFFKNNFKFVLKDNFNIDIVMKKITLSFGKYINKKHGRTGRVFSDRFSSLPATNLMDTYNFMCAVHFVCNKKSFNSKYNYLKNKFLDYDCIDKNFVNKRLFLNFLNGLCFSDDVQNILIKLFGEKNFNKSLAKQMKKENIIENENITKVKKLHFLSKILNFANTSARKYLINVTTKSIEDRTKKYENYLSKKAEKSNKRSLKKRKKIEQFPSAKNL